MNSFKERWNDEDHDSDDEQVTPDNWDDSESEEAVEDQQDVRDDLNKEKDRNELKEPICLIDRPVHWKKFSKHFRKLRKLPTVIQDPRTVRIYIEQKEKRVTAKKAKVLKGAKNNKGDKEPLRPPVIDKRFDSWQIEMARALIRGDHVILDVATSCGKTWAVRNVIGEIVLRDNSTAIFVTPNYEILQENIKAILIDNRKTYQHLGHTVGGLQTKQLCNKKDDQPLSCQILCMTADNVSDFMTSAVNKDFVSNLKFVILDEVHTEDVNSALWRLSLMPPSIQFVLLSATIGNTDWLQEELRLFRSSHHVAVIRWHLRPISLQRALFPKTLDLNPEGARVFGNQKEISKEKEAFKERFVAENGPIFCPNLIDPTAKDIAELSNLSPTVRIQEKEIQNRTEEYDQGQRIVKTMDSATQEKYHELVDKNIESSYSVENDLEDDPRIILAAFQTLNSMGLGPALFFNNDSTKIVEIGKKLLTTIQNLEYEDKDVRDQFKKIEKAEKDARRVRDLNINIRSESEITKLQLRQNERDKDGRHNGRNASRSDSAIGNSKVIEIPCAPDKWRFTRFSEKIPRKTPGWIAELLHYGIGIYTSLMSRWLKDAMFEWFDKRKLAFILCDRSLSLGINLPVRSVILTGRVDRTIFEQMGGRAGRRGYDTEGYVFLATNKNMMKELLHDEVQIRHIRPMLGLSVLDILRWHKESTLIDKEAVKNYIGRYQDILNGVAVISKDSKRDDPYEKRKDDEFDKSDFDSFCFDRPSADKPVQKEVEEDESMTLIKKNNEDSQKIRNDQLEIYNLRLQWLKETGWLKSKYCNLVMNLDDLPTMILLHLIRKGKIDMMFLNALDFTKDINEVIRPFLTLLCYLWEERVVSEETDSGILDRLDPKIEDELKELCRIFGVHIPFNQKCSDYIFRFMKHGEFNSDTREDISRFQRRLSLLLSGMKAMTSGSMTETEPIITLLQRIEKEFHLADLEEDKRTSNKIKYSNLDHDEGTCLAEATGINSINEISTENLQDEE